MKHVLYIQAVLVIHYDNERESKYELRNEKFHLTLRRIVQLNFELNHDSAPALLRHAEKKMKDEESC